MAECFTRIFTRRLVVIAVIVLAGGAAAAVAGVAQAAGSGRGGATSPGGGPVATVPVVRTDLIATTQVGGSIGYGGSHTVAAPSGTSASQVSQAQQAVAADQQALSADERAQADALASGSQAISAAQAVVGTDRATLGSDLAAEAQDCAGSGASSAACGSDEQKVSQDQQQLAQARQQLRSARLAARTAGDQAQAKVGTDQVKLRGDRATLASDQASAVNPGTTYTWLPTVGQVIRQDQPAYSVSDQPVPLLYGSIPAYRAFYAGMSDGGDVGELTHDLIALGYGSGLARSDHYSPATAAAVGRWQQAHGLAVTGQILLGEVMFEPGPVRVTSVTPPAGAPVSGAGGGGVVLTATGTTPVVTVDLPVTQEYLVRPGDTVSVCDSKLGIRYYAPGTEMPGVVRVTSCNAPAGEQCPSGGPSPGGGNRPVPGASGGSGANG